MGPAGGFLRPSRRAGAAAEIRNAHLNRATSRPSQRLVPRIMRLFLDQTLCPGCHELVLQLPYQMGVPAKIFGLSRIFTCLVAILLSAWISEESVTHFNQPGTFAIQ
jgi:hypothetical protein